MSLTRDILRYRIRGTLPNHRVLFLEGQMDTEREEDKKPLSRETARELLAEAWLDFWSGSRTPHDSDMRGDKIREVLERLSPADREYFLKEEGGGNSELAKIREQTKAITRTGKKDAPSAGERLHIRRQKAAKRGVNQKRIR